jgi:2-polyprenyl-3-methyl-5-hydroxy-6-metoxy-1,4-benzoquinol methylase
MKLDFSDDDFRERPDYVFDNAAEQAPARFSALSELYDENTIRHLTKIGVAQGWRCWEIGAGQGSIARWLSRQVRPTGSVLATDIDTRFLEQSTQRNLTVNRHDIVSEPLPAERFDLIHARLVLVHLPEREEVLQRMISVLKPGGWLLAEEFDSVSQVSVAETYPGETTLKSTVALRKVMVERGVDLAFGGSLAKHLQARGLENILAEGYMRMWFGGSQGVHLMRANFEQLREPILASGAVTEIEFAEDIARLDAPNFMTPSPVMWSVAGRQPLNQQTEMMNSEQLRP